MEKKRKGIIYAVIPALIFGSMPVLSDIIFKMGSNPVTLTFYRNLFSVPLLFIVLLFRKVDFRVTLKETLEILTIGVVFRCITNISLYSSYQYIGVGLATILNFMYPLITLLVEKVLFKKKISKTRHMAIFLAILGVIISSGDIDFKDFKGIMLAMISAVAYSGYLVGMERMSISRMDTMKLMFYMGMYSSIILWIIDIPTKNIKYNLSLSVIGITFIISFLTGIVAYIFLIQGIRFIGAIDVALFGTLEPVVAIILGNLLLNEKFSVTLFAGCLLILMGVILPNIGEIKYCYRKEESAN